MEENKVLKEQLDKHRGCRRLLLTDDQRRRLAAKAKIIGRKALREVGCIFTPDTIMRWYARLIAKKYDGSGKRGPGRPRKLKEIRRLVVRVAMENPGWGYTRIMSALRNRMLFFSEAALRRAICEYVEHYHTERNHQGLDNHLIRPPVKEPPAHGPVECRKRLGGLLKFYCRRAA